MVEIRDLTAGKDLQRCVDIEAETWGPEVLHRVDVEHLRRTVAAGGILLGAFEGRNLAGFVFSYRIEVDGVGIQHSHLLAVGSGDRGRGFGLRLKLAQREAARKRGDALIVWTFDPLEAVNAKLNLGRLGAISRRYLMDFYGETGSPLHAGLPTDRLLAEWTVTSPGERPSLSSLPSEQAPAPGRDSRIVETRLRGDGLVEPVKIRLGLDATALSLPIPPHIQDLKRLDPELATRWSLAVRRTFLHYLDRGYEARGFVDARQVPEPLPPGYVLARAPRARGLVDGLDLTTVPFRSRVADPGQSPLE
jgi:predicted GNAT superfamily acetyltransferase